MKSMKSAALANAFILCQHILNYNANDSKNESQLDFEVRHNKNTGVAGGIEVVINRLLEINDKDIDLIMEANSILRGSLAIKKTGEISVTFA